MRIFNAIGCAALVFALDQLSKFGVLELLQLRERGGFIEVAPFLNFALAYNKGVNFGLLASAAEWQPFLLAGFAVFISGLLLLWAARTEDWRVAWGCGLAAGGALANALDRVWSGAVIDFLNFDCCGIGNPYAFNLADVGVFLGAAFIVWSTWTESDKDSAEG